MMTVIASHESFQAAIKANPGDESTLLVYADWLEENGQLPAAEYRRAEANRIIDAKAEAMKIHATVGQSAWTREEADPENGAKGYDARVAHKILLADPTVYVVIVSGTAPTHRNLKYVGRSGVVYYRKSSGGKWGRSVQQRFVALKGGAA